METLENIRLFSQYPLLLYVSFLVMMDVGVVAYSALYSIDHGASIIMLFGFEFAVLLVR